MTWLGAEGQGFGVKTSRVCIDFVKRNNVIWCLNYEFVFGEELLGGGPDSTCYLCCGRKCSKKIPKPFISTIFYMVKGERRLF